MTTIYFSTYLFAITTSFLLAFFLLTSNKKNKTILFLSYAGIVVGLWFIVEFFVKFFGLDEFDGLLAWKATVMLRYIGVILFTCFVVEFAQKTVPRVLSAIFILVLTLLSALVVFTDKVFENITLSVWGGYDRVLGEWAYYILPTVAFSMLVPGYFLFLRFLELEKGSRIKRQVLYLFIGSALIFVAAFVDDVVFPFLGMAYLNIAHIAVAIFEIIIFYIIYKLEAFEIGILKFKVRHKILIGLLLSAIVPLIIVYSINFEKYREALVESAVNEARSSVLVHSAEINTYLHQYHDDTIHLAHSAQVHRFIEGDPTESQSELRKQLEKLFVTFARENESYTQLRYIDENGYEMVRVNSDGVNMEIVSENDLQYKGNRDYFIEGMDTEQGEVYASSISLNKEGDPPKVEIPYKPVSRYSVAVSDSEDNKKGMIIINIDADYILESIHAKHHTHELEMFLNQDGYYIYHPNEEKEFGGPRDLNTGYNLKNDLPSVADEILSGQTGVIVLRDEVFSYDSIYLENGRFYIILEIIPRAAIFGFIDKLNRTTYISFVFVLLLIFTMGYWIARTISNPINKLHENVEKMRAGDLSQKVDITSQDEIGDLARAYSELMVSLSESRKNIEKKVKDQTKDINKQKDEIAFERDKLDITLQSIGEGVFVTDENHKIILFNEEIERISGYKAEEALGKPCYDVLKFVTEGTNKEAGACIKDALEKGVPQIMEDNSELIKKDGSRIAVADSAAPIKDGKGKIVGVVVVIRDATIERAVGRAKSEFVSTVSHQLRTPLVGIRWVIERFTKEEKLTKKGKEYLGDIERSMLRLAELVDALLNVSRLEGSGGVSIIPEPVELVSYVESFMSENRPLLAKKNLKFIFENKPNELNIKTDKSAFGNIIQSLVANSLEYTKKDGEIEISIEEKKIGRREGFVMSIRDTGIGIPKGEQKNMFTKFSRGSNARLVKTSGTGLGLFIAQQATTLLGGVIRFESEENKGTTFFVELPKESKEVEGSKPLT